MGHQSVVLRRDSLGEMDRVSRLVLPYLHLDRLGKIDAGDVSELEQQDQHVSHPDLLAGSSNTPMAISLLTHRK